MQKIELLAPAGSMQALHAAVRAGANAVYLGLEAFNARRGADNFTLESLEEACRYAHLRDVSIYVTLNTAILPEETNEVLELARQAYRAGADAFIVQDIGLAGELARALPEARLHISTQMNTHNEAGIRAAARLGAKRVTLARELSLEEIANLAACARELGMEIETFAHGALCICYSGQCLMSSMIGGRSANRGTCAQACRLPFELRNAAISKELPAPGDHLLSPKDLCAVELLPSLIEAGVASFKIEGRMKAPEYVFAVVSVYRAVIDRILAGEGAEVSSDELNQLAEAFSRGFTTAYLEGQRGNDIMSYQRPNNRGVFLGRVDEVRNGRAAFVSERELHAGDVVEFWTRKGHTAVAVGEFSVDRKGRTSIPLDQKAKGVREGDRVFRVRSAEAAFEDDALEPRIPVRGSVLMQIGSPLIISFEALGRSNAAGLPLIGEARGPVVEPARTRPVSEQDVRAHVDRLGSTPYVIDELDVFLDEGAGIGFSQLHQVRAAALEALTEELLAPAAGRTLPRVAPREVLPEARVQGCRIAAWATNPACARAAKRAGADIIFVPTLNYRRGEAVIAGQLSGTAEQAGYPKQCVPAMPTVDHDPVGFARETCVDFSVWKYAEEGKPLFVDSLASMQLASEIGAEFEVGPHVPITNRLALEQAYAFGARRVWLSPELTLKQIRDLAQESPVELGLVIIGTQELMITEHCLLMSQGPCNQQCASCARRKSPHYLRDRKGVDFPVVTDLYGRSHLYNSVALDVAHAMPDLLAAGISSFMVDTTLMNSEEAAQAVGRAVRALKVAQLDGNSIAKMPNATSGHLFRGVL